MIKGRERAGVSGGAIMTGLLKFSVAIENSMARQR